MRGASRDSLAELTELLARRAAERGVGGFGELADQLAAVLGVLSDNAELRRALTDNDAAGHAKEGLVRSLFESRVSPLTLEVLTASVAGRWSRPTDLLDALEETSEVARFHVAEAADALDEVEDELYRLARIVAGAPTLRDLLTDPDVPTPRRLAVVRDLIGHRVQAPTLAIVELVTARPRGRRVEDVLQRAAELATERHGQIYAVATSAVPLDQGQVDRLAAALARVYGRPVTVSVALDPRVLGGVRVRVGDEMIDGTVAHRLEQARERLAG